MASLSLYLSASACVSLHSQLESQRSETCSVFLHTLIVNRCLDSILHAEHKSILEEMRSDYQLANPLQTHSSLTQLVNVPNVNTKDSDTLIDDNDNIAIQEDANLYDDQQSVFPYPALDLTALLRSLDIAATKKDYDSGSRFVSTHTPLSLCSFVQFKITEYRHH